MISFCIGLLGLGFCLISIEVIRARRRLKIALGPGENNEILPLISAQQNYTSNTLFFIILLFIGEQTELPLILLNSSSIIFIFGRLFHYLGVRSQRQNFKLRVLGMIMTFFSLIGISAGLLVNPFV